MKLMVVAHSDDETLWGAANLLQENWKVICITNGDDPIRRKEFEKVMEMTNSEFEIWNYPDVFRKLFNEESLTRDLKRVIEGYDKILTHNSMGEYNNLHHIQVHRIMKKLVNNLLTFGFSNPLPDNIWFKKLELIQVYKSQKKVCKRFLALARMEKII